MFVMKSQNNFIVSCRMYNILY